MSVEVQKVRERYETAAFSSLLKANQNLAAIIELPLQVALAGTRATEAYRDQWDETRRYPEPCFDWIEIWRRHRDFATLHLAVWVGNYRLAALATFLVSKVAVEVRFVEGDPRSDCPLKGRRTFPVLEAAASYAQAIGRAEVRVQPVNKAVRDLYVAGYGFEAVKQAGIETYFRRLV